MGHIVDFFWTDTYGADPRVPTAALMEFKEEEPTLAAKREASIDYLRGRPVSRYVLDGAKVDWTEPEVLRRTA